jgi:hypothetical protein
MQVFAKAHSNHEETGQVEVANLSTPERITIVATRSGIFLTLAAVSIFIPVLHFILVPGFIVAAVAAGLSSSRYSQKLTGGSVPCPHCKQLVTLKEMPLKWPLASICQNCASTVRLYATSQANS